MIWEERLSGEEERREAWKVRRWVVRWATPCVLREVEGKGGNGRRESASWDGRYGTAITRIVRSFEVSHKPTHKKQT